MIASHPNPEPSDGPLSLYSAPWREFASAPIVPVTLAATGGLIIDRYLGVTVSSGLLVATLALIGWFVVRNHRPTVALGLIAVMFAALAAVYHHTHRHSFPADDIGEVIRTEPQLMRLRAMLTDDPVTRFAPTRDPFEPSNHADHDAVILRVSAVATRDSGWVDASGLVRLTTDRDANAFDEPPLVGLQVGDEIELLGMAFRPGPPRNPGEADYASHLLDQRIRAEIRVSDSAAITRLKVRSLSTMGLLVKVRRVANESIRSHLPRQQAGTATALLLGDGSAMERAEWDAYIRTGVVHVLAISGQHLAVLAGFLWFALRLFGVSRVSGAWVVVLVIIGYTVLTGLRPSGVRAAVMVTVACGGLILRRPMCVANSFALSWFIIIVLNPTDPFTLGCQLSFLSVFALIWGAGRWLVPRRLTPIEQLIDESRPLWLRVVRGGLRTIGAAYLLTWLIAAVNAPLLLADQHVVSPIGLLIGPPIVALSSIALVAGFLFLLLAPLGLAGSLVAVPTQFSLLCCEQIVTTADAVPGGVIFVAGTPMWWLIGFYALFAAVVLTDKVLSRKCVMALSLWVLLGLLVPTLSGPSDELRVTFLAVGKGGCVVIETPDDRCVIYDVGTTTGPAAVRRVVAPYLWHRGISRIDELFLSHADSDHFNGLGELVRRFPVGQITMTPSFAVKPTREVEAALTIIHRARIPSRLAFAGHRFTAGDVEIEVLHPQQSGPPGTENERSLVLMVRHVGHTILLTGDLEKRGTTMMLEQIPQRADVLMAPHHGSRAALPNQLLEWSQPQLVVVSRGPVLGNSIDSHDVGTHATTLWDTQIRGAVTITSHATGLMAESFATRERFVVRRGSTRSNGHR